MVSTIDHNGIEGFPRLGVASSKVLRAKLRLVWSITVVLLPNLKVNIEEVFEPLFMDLRRNSSESKLSAVTDSLDVLVFAASCRYRMFKFVSEFVSLSHMAAEVGSGGVVWLAKMFLFFCLVGYCYWVWLVCWKVRYYKVSAVCLEWWKFG